jgi:transposase
MSRGRTAVSIVLDDAGTAALTALVRKHGAPQSVAMRARIVLAAASGLTNKEIAARLDVCAHTAGVWRNRFARDGMDGLYDEPRPGAPRQIGDDEIAATIRKTLETRPQGATHWSLWSMGKAVGHAPSALHRLWQAFGLQPHRSESFTLSSDPLFVEKVRDIVGLYLSPPERAVVLCVDEKSQVQALDRIQPLLPMRPGQVERHSHDYMRHGTTSLFAALDVKAGTIAGKCMPRHRRQEFRKFLDEVERNVPAPPRPCAQDPADCSMLSQRIRPWRRAIYRFRPRSIEVTRSIFSCAAVFRKSGLSAIVTGSPDTLRISAASSNATSRPSPKSAGPIPCGG